MSDDEQNCQFPQEWWEVEIERLQARVDALEKECHMHKTNDDMTRRANQIWSDRVDEAIKALKGEGNGS